jgi:hypothetical protein
LPFESCPVSWPGPPQQSPLVAQISFWGRQPEGGWQTFTPVVPSGPHESEQHLLSQPLPVQIEPAGLQGAVPRAAQRPYVAPAAMSQLPLQHSKSLAQMSLSCEQYDAFVQNPAALHCFEQQSVFVVQGLPSVRHVPPAMATHLPVPPTSHLPLQHSASAVQLWATGVSALHCVAEHLPLTQEFVQHSVPLTQSPPAAVQEPPPPSALAPHCPSAAPAALRHAFVQHSLAAEHVWPTRRQTCPSRREPSPPASPTEPLLLELLPLELLVLPLDEVELDVPSALASPLSRMPSAFSLPQPTNTTFSPAAAVTSASTLQGSFLIRVLLSPRRTARSRYPPRPRRSRASP